MHSTCVFFTCAPWYAWMTVCPSPHECVFVCVGRWAARPRLLLPAPLGAARERGSKEEIWGGREGWRCKLQGKRRKEEEEAVGGEEMRARTQEYGAVRIIHSSSTFC